MHLKSSQVMSSSCSGVGCYNNQHRDSVMEKNIIKCFYHELPLILTENVSKEEASDCYGCGNLVTNSEAAYVCTVQHCLNGIILHKKCGELPNEIWHPKHPQHPISLFDYHRVNRGWCDVCLGDLRPVLGYQCSTCDFDYDIICEELSIDAILGGKIQVEHPSHPDHPLTLMRKSPLSFCCDGCGVQDMDMAYICSTCEFMVHKSCASLPLILPINLQYHHHHLSLAFTFPVEHVKYISNCDVCLKILGRACWVYFCGDCRFFAHTRCVAYATKRAEQDSNADGDDNDGSDVIEFPLYAHDISKELITPFVMREKVLNKTPDVKDMPSTVNMEETDASFSFLFNYHKHPLSLVSEPHEDEEEDHNIIKDEDEEEEDGDEAAYDDELKICDVCVTPITSPPYYECSVACKYFVHSICYFLPKTLSPLELHGDCPKTHDKNHRFTLYTSSKLMDMDNRLCRCELCKFITNGRVYECEGCEMKIDVKCASLPTTIRHASHHHHKGLVLNRIPSGGNTKRCHGCNYRLEECTSVYCCSSDDCDFALDLKCAMLPKSITKHEWDTTHSFPLTFDASLDHPSDFFCDFCEEELHPKKWMYHCRQCDLSFHLFCLKTASGVFRNIKFGRRFVLDGLHPNHPLTFNCVTLKRRCDICHSEVYGYGGLECASCNYVVCLTCARRELVKKHVICS